MHRRVLFLVLTTLLLLTAFGAAAQEAEAPALPDLGGREITIAVENAYTPFNFINSQGEAVGWDYDTFRDICRLLNCVPVFVETAWDGMLIALANGEFDIAGDGITATPDRDETVDFSQLYNTYAETLVVREDETRFATVEELQAVPDYLVGTQTGTTNAITAAAVFGENVLTFPEFGAAIQALINGDVDAVEVDRPSALGYLETTAGLKILDNVTLATQGLAFAFPTGSDLIEPINAAMTHMMESGRWDQLYTRWFETADLPDLGGQEITVAVENAYVPFNYINDQGEAVGWDYDTFNAMCALLNCTPVFVETAWEGMLVAIASGEFDVAGDGITATPDRDETVDFSQLYNTYQETLVVRADETRFATVEELQAVPDYLVGTQTGTTNAITAAAVFGENVLTFPEFGAAIQALLNGDVDAVELDRPSGMGYLQTTPGLKILDNVTLATQGLAFAFPTGSELVEPINAAMNWLIATGVWDDLYVKWFES